MNRLEWYVGAVMVAAVLAPSCGDDGGPDEVHQCGDGTELEVLRVDEADSGGNIARVRRLDTEGELIGEGERVTEAELDAAIESCRAG